MSRQFVQITIKSSPGENGKDLVVLHEGTKVMIMDEVEGITGVVAVTDHAAGTNPFYCGAAQPLPSDSYYLNQCVFHLFQWIRKGLHSGLNSILSGILYSSKIHVNTFLNQVNHTDIDCVSKLLV